VLDDGRLADILSTGGPDFAAVELVRASLEAGSSDNVTCIVADVVDGSTPVDSDEPILVGAAAELRRRSRSSKGSLFRGHRSGDTGELEPVAAEIPDDVPFAISNDPLGPGRPAGSCGSRDCWPRSSSSASAGSPWPGRTPGASSSTSSASRTAAW
jgi:protein phosphatase